MRIFLVIGSGLSGSTLLSYLLGAHSSVVNVGELDTYSRYRASNPQRMCADGRPFGEHPFWTRVQLEFEREAGPRLPVMDHTRGSQFIADHGALWRAIEKVSGRPCAVQSLKSTARLRALIGSELAPQISLIHLTRDPRARYFSIASRGGDKRGKPLWLKSLGWSRTNHFCLGCEDSGLPYYRLRYEDLAMNLEHQLRLLMAFLGLAFETRQMRYYDVEQPAFSGNGRLMQRRDAVRLRTEYMREMGALEWWLTSCLTFPTNVRAGYKLSRSHSRP